jgi:hypothetical protein
MINRMLAIITVLSLTFSIVLCVKEIKQVSDWQNWYTIVDGYDIKYDKCGYFCHKRNSINKKEKI